MGLPEIYPFVRKIISPNLDLGEPFDPIGITIHYTASRDILGVEEALRKKKLRYHLVIDRDGSVIQLASLTHTVAHAGKAIWKGKSPNREHISIALLSWGLLDKNKKTWTGKGLPDNEIAFRQGEWWDKATMLQEESLITVCRWLLCFRITPEGICGHHECCIPKGRKSDPGGVLSMEMEAFRRLVPTLQV